MRPNWGQDEKWLTHRHADTACGDQRHAAHAHTETLTCGDQADGTILAHAHKETVELAGHGPSGRLGAALAILKLQPKLVRAANAARRRVGGWWWGGGGRLSIVMLIQ